MSFDYSQSPYPIADFKADAHRGAWTYLAQPGSWWTGADRIAIAAASRDAAFCPLCAERKAALSPFSVTGKHNSDAGLLNASDLLTAKVLDAAHRITTDSARLTES